MRKPAQGIERFSANYGPGEEGGLYKSVDQGESFKQVSSHSGIRTRPFYYTNIKIDPTNSDILYAMATGYYKSEDGGKTWNRLNPPHGDNHDIWLDPGNPDRMMVAHDGCASITLNHGKSYQRVVLPIAQMYHVSVDLNL